MTVQGLMAMGPPPVPAFLFILKIALAVLTFGVFIASCYNVAQLANNAFGSGPGGLGIFVSIWTWALLGIEIFFGLSMHQIYLRIVFIIAFLLAKIFWLATWADAASGAVVLSDCFGDNFCTRYGGSLAAIAALGAFCWILDIAILVFYVLACLRDTTAGPQATTYQANNGYGQPAAYGQPAYASNVQPNMYGQPPQNAELGNMKTDGTQNTYGGVPA